MASHLSESELKAALEQVKNWGRWGKEDQRGALNFITDKKRAAAGKLVQSGQIVSLGLPLATKPAADNPRPVMHLMVQVGVDSDNPAWPSYSADYFGIAPHGMSKTHLDALCHVFYHGKMYNGFDVTEVGSQGARKCAIDVTRDGVISRGVMLDIPKIKKVEWLELGTRIFPDDLEAAERDHGVRVEEGDILLVRTGRARRRKIKGGWEAFRDGMPGLDTSCLTWLHERKIAVLGSDGVSDVIPSGYQELVTPIHIGTLVMMGVHLIDNCDFDALSETCAKLGRYEFLFTMAPLILERGTASPVNPIALF